MGDKTGAETANDVSLIDEVTGYRQAVPSTDGAAAVAPYNSSGARIDPATSSDITALRAAASAVYNVTCVSANTEYSQALPSGCKKFTLKCRQARDVKATLVSGESGTKYLTIPSGSSWSEDSLNLSGKSLYFQTGNANSIVEIVAWS